MAKGKLKGTKTPYISKGRVGVDRSISKAVRNGRPPLEHANKVFDTWKRAIPGAKTPKMIQKSLGITADTSYRDWTKKFEDAKKKENSTSEG
jgi:hypothetical protein